MPVRKKAVKAAKVKPKSSKPRAKVIDLSALPAELLTTEHRDVCLACVLDVMTRHVGLALAKAQTEIRRYVPSLDELRAREFTRPFFLRHTESDACPYCSAPAKWCARLTIHRIESAKASDAQRRAILKSLKEPSFAIVEEKATQQDAFFQWADRISAALDMDDPRWLLDASRHYLSRKEPKTDWNSAFQQIRVIRRSRRLDEGYEVDANRLFLAPLLFDELLLVQYLISRAHRSGGLTLEGRYTLPELFARLRNSGYLRHAGVDQHNPSDAFEQLVTQLSGGESAQRFYYAVDRRDLLERLKSLKDVRVPRIRVSEARQLYTGKP